MKEKAELVRGWLRKAESDSLALKVTLGAGALDAACFHAQQSAEKYLKAFLAHQEIPFPYTHNLTKLVELCAGIDSEFRSLLPRVEALTPYAVRPRYDPSFSPTQQAANEARDSAVMFEISYSTGFPGIYWMPKDDTTDSRQTRTRSDAMTFDDINRAKHEV